MSYIGIIATDGFHCYTSARQAFAFLAIQCSTYTSIGCVCVFTIHYFPNDVVLNHSYGQVKRSLSMREYDVRSICDIGAVLNGLIRTVLGIMIWSRFRWISMNVRAES